MNANSSHAPLDVVAALALALLAGVLTVLAPGSAVAVAVGVPLVLVVPGYLATLALFPASETGPELVVRVLLSVTLSVAAVFAIAMVVMVLPVAFTAPVLVATLSVFVAVAAAVAVVRRRRLAPRRRFQLHPASVLGSASPLRGDEGLLVSVVLALCLVVATAGVGLAYTSADSGYTEFYLLNDDGQAEDYPRSFDAGEPRSLVAGIGNHHASTVEYSVVVVLQRVDDDGAVQSQQRLDQFTATLDPGESREFTRQVAPETTGDRLKLAFLLYEDEVPETPRASNAAHALHLWISVD